MPVFRSIDPQHPRTTTSPIVHERKDRLRPSYRSGLETVSVAKLVTLIRENAGQIITAVQYGRPLIEIGTAFGATAAQAAEIGKTED
jgi:hypothetical protein